MTRTPPSTQGRERKDPRALRLKATVPFLTVAGMGWLVAACATGGPPSHVAAALATSAALEARVTPAGLWCSRDGKTSAALALRVANISKAPIRFNTGWLGADAWAWSNPVEHDFFAQDGQPIPTATTFGSHDCLPGRPGAEGSRRRRSRDFIGQIARRVSQLEMPIHSSWTAGLSIQGSRFMFRRPVRVERTGTPPAARAPLYQRARFARYRTSTLSVDRRIRRRDPVFTRTVDPRAPGNQIPAAICRRMACGS